MRNRAKCKLCQSIIESFHQFDHITCKCSEISISGGDFVFTAYAKDFANFLRVDDEGNEIIVSYTDKLPDKDTEQKLDEPPKKVTKKELLDILDTMIKADESLPEQAQHAPLSYYDLLRYMLVIQNILKKDE